MCIPYAATVDRPYSGQFLLRGLSQLHRRWPFASDGDIQLMNSWIITNIPCKTLPLPCSDHVLLLTPLLSRGYGSENRFACFGLFYITSNNFTLTRREETQKHLNYVRVHIDEWHHLLPEGVAASRLKRNAWAVTVLRLHAQILSILEIGLLDVCALIYIYIYYGRKSILLQCTLLLACSLRRACLASSTLNTVAMPARMCTYGKT